MTTGKEQLKAEIAKRDARIAELEAERARWERIAQDLWDKDDATFAAALKAQQPSAGVADERAAFEAWYSEHYYEGDESCTRQWLFREPCGNYRHEHASRDWRTWQARARLNPCRAQAVPDGKICVTTCALYEVLYALINAPHQIRELQATLEPAELFADNPINILVAEYKAAQQKESE